MANDRQGIINLLKEGEIDQAIKETDLDSFTTQGWNEYISDDLILDGNLCIYLATTLNLVSERILKGVTHKENIDWERFLTKVRVQKSRQKQDTIREGRYFEGGVESEAIDSKPDQELMDMAYALLGLEKDEEKTYKIEDRLPKILPEVHRYILDKRQVSFSELNIKLKIFDDERLNKVLILLSLLFLTTENKIEISQAKNFGEIEARPIETVEPEKIEEVELI